MACPNYRERLGGKVIGYCRDSRKSIPSQRHQECLCQSDTGIYVEFCPIFAKLRQNTQKQSIFSRIFTNGNGTRSKQRMAEIKK